MATKIDPRLIKHCEVADLCGVDAKTLRKWVDAGDFPRPHSTFQTTWLYDRPLINHWLETGQWLDRAKFRPKRAVKSRQGA